MDALGGITLGLTGGEPGADVCRDYLRVDPSLDLLAIAIFQCARTV
jgi:hypothetical protein